MSGLSTPAPYVGGKRNLASLIIDIIGKIPHQTYVEPFVGMAGVFLRRPTPARCEVINDLNGEVANLFRVLQRHFVALTDMLRWQVTSREHFERLRDTAPESLTDLERAVRLLYVQRIAYGGKVRGQTFNYAQRTARFDVTKLLPALDDIHHRLASVTIECLPYGRLIERYDGPGVLFYLDPPYWGSEDYYAAAFDRAEFGRLADQLASLRGTFVLSINDRPETREVFAAFNLMEVEAAYGLDSRYAERAPRGELLVSNTPLKRG
ncbi:DNA adenine methylase [Acetobacter sp. DsW_063]|uniref:DNA adenine methylase n=1 Tax=Acetobacter sp. DsW_063 TaxID=1514894 RepID=UPI001E574DF3|nr:DNA adenine methylase [Acetobacter sp. DsW_063]